MARGYLVLVLHAHLPFVRHPEYPSFYEETWLFEAIIDTYIPLLKVFEKLADDGAQIRVTVSLSPPLIAMLRDPVLQERFLAHLKKLSQLGDKEIIRNHGVPLRTEVARLYRRILYETEEAFETRYRRDLVGAFQALQQRGVLELITAGATHGYLPILKTQPKTVRAQLAVAADVYERTFGRTVPGFWLPECGYFPGVEEHVAAVGGKYFFVDTHGILHAERKPAYGYLAPLACPNGVVAYGRDPGSSRLVWSANEGYPGDPWYRDFYKDIGFELDFDYIRPYILDGETRIFTGFKYHRVTGQTDQKEVYEPERARERADVHAADFVRRQLELVRRHAPNMDRPPVIVALYDAELFGHWWFEGPMWLDYVIRKLHYDQAEIELIAPSDDIARHGDRIERIQPSASSWGEKGYSEFWLNAGNDWIYRHLHEAGRRMSDAAQRYKDVAAGSLGERALNQAARALLLAQSSDWPFIMKTGTSVGYAEGRVRDHLARFHFLLDSVDAGTIPAETLTALEAMDNIFPDLSFRIYA